jgi:hypothetical protein
MTEYIEAYWKPCVREVRRLLEPEGVAFVRQIGPENLGVAEIGLVKAVIRQTARHGWSEQDCESHWLHVLRRAIETPKEERSRLLKALLKSYSRK